MPRTGAFCARAAFEYTTLTIATVYSGKVGNDCTGQFPNGVGSCSNGNCVLQSCADGYKTSSSTSCGLIFLFCSSTTTCVKVDTDSDEDNW